MRSWCVLLAAAAMALAAPNVRAADLCSTCEVQLGLGATYHFWGYTHGLLVPAALNFDHDRWELGAFRFAKAQSYFNSTFGADVDFANPVLGLFPVAAAGAVSTPALARGCAVLGLRTRPKRTGCPPRAGISPGRRACGSRPGRAGASSWSGVTGRTAGSSFPITARILLR